MSAKLHKCLIKAKFFKEFMADARCADINFEHGYEKMRVYKCDSCGYFHLTTNK